MNAVHALRQVSIDAAASGQTLVALVAAGASEVEALSAQARSAGTRLDPAVHEVRLDAQSGADAAQVVGEYAAALRERSGAPGPAQDWSHLVGVVLPGDEDVAALEEDLLGGRESREHARTHAAYAALLGRAAHGMLAADRRDDAFRCAYRADLAVLRAHLVATSVASGDWSLVVSQVRWLAAMVALGAASLPADVPGAVAAVRATIEAACPLAGASAITWPPAPGAGSKRSR